MPQTDPSRTEKATPKRRDKARQEGNVAKSQEIPKVTILLGGLLALHFFIGGIGTELQNLYIWFLGPAFSTDLTPDNVYGLMVFTMGKMAMMLLPLFFILATIAFLSIRFQVGPLWTTKVFEPKFERVLNPLNGLKKLFISTTTLIRLAKSLLQALAVGLAPYLVLKSEIPNFLPLFYQDAHGITAYILKTGSTMVIYALVPMIIIAMADLAYTRWDYEQNLMMTKDEVKDERKQSEGDPAVKMAQRKKMFAVMQQRMLEKVPEADVVITNPTHFAVALRYNPLVAPAPLVLAKGADHMAEKIKEIAREHNIPIRENKPLAQALYKSVDIGETIPEEFYKTVASILAQLHKFRKSRRTNS